MGFTLWPRCSPGGFSQRKRSGLYRPSPAPQLRLGFFKGPKAVAAELKDTDRLLDATADEAALTAVEAGAWGPENSGIDLTP